MWQLLQFKIYNLLGLMKETTTLFRISASSIWTFSVRLLYEHPPAICCLKAASPQSLDACFVVFGSLGLLGLFGVLAQPGLPGTQRHVRAVWITEGMSPASPSGPSDSLSGFISSNCARTVTAIQTGTVYSKAKMETVGSSVRAGFS